MHKRTFIRFLGAATTAVMLGSAVGLCLPVSASGIRFIPIAGITVENAAGNVYAEAVDPLGNGMNASRITVRNGAIVNETAFPGHHDDRAKLIAGAAGVAGSQGLAFYVDFSSGNAFCFTATMKCEDPGRWNNDWNPDLTQKVGSSYYVLASGGEWEEKKAGKGWTSDTWWGCVEFDAPFSGYVFIPWESLGHDGGFAPDFDQDTLYSVTMYPKKVGGAAGSPIFGPLYTVAAQTASVFPEVTVPQVESMGKDTSVTAVEIPSPIPYLTGENALRITGFTSGAWELEGAVYSLYDFSHGVSFTYSGVAKSSFTHLLLYVRNSGNAENYMALSVTAETAAGMVSTECRLATGAPYQLLAVDGAEWQHHISLRSVTQDGLIGLPAGFQGFVKIPVESLPLFNKDGSLSLLSQIRIGFASAGEKGVIVSPLLCVAQDNAPGPSLPAATTEKVIFPVETGDIFSQRVMLYWESFPNAHHYRMEAYQAAEADQSPSYTMVTTREAFTTSGTLTGLTAETAYILVVKAYDAYNREIAVYSPVTVNTAVADPYAQVISSDEFVRDPVYYPATPTNPATTTGSEASTTTTDSGSSTTTGGESSTTAAGSSTMATSSDYTSVASTETTHTGTEDPPRTGYGKSDLLMAAVFVGIGGLIATVILIKGKSRA